MIVNRNLVLHGDPNELPYFVETAELGRFLQTDPIGYYDSMNLYQYCLNKPINWIDTWGLYSEFIVTDEYIRRLQINEMETHYNRNINNITPNTETEAEYLNWQKLSDNKAVYRRRGIGGKLNQKLISPSGQCEAVYDKDGNLVTDPVNVGTYNFVPPNKPIGHFFKDILPYWMYGNSHDDPICMWHRIGGTYRGEIPK